MFKIAGVHTVPLLYPVLLVYLLDTTLLYEDTNKTEKNLMVVKVEAQGV